MNETTNEQEVLLLRRKLDLLLRTDFQTAGKGQMGNSWEAEAGKNLLS